jgi:hypothetical protein
MELVLAISLGFVEELYLRISTSKSKYMKNYLFDLKIFQNNSVNQFSSIYESVTYEFIFINQNAGVSGLPNGVVDGRTLKWFFISPLTKSTAPLP